MTFCVSSFQNCPLSDAWIKILKTSQDEKQGKETRLLSCEIHGWIISYGRFFDIRNRSVHFTTYARDESTHCVSNMINTLNVTAYISLNTSQLVMMKLDFLRCCENFFHRFCTNLYTKEWQMTFCIAWQSRTALLENSVRFHFKACFFLTGSPFWSTIKRSVNCTNFNFSHKMTDLH